MRKVKIKRQELREPPFVKTPAKVAFNFSELRTISYSDAKRDGAFFINFIGRLKKLCSLDWNTINRSERHSFGTETMSVSKLTKAAQEKAPSGVDSFKVFRATGNNHVFLGYREENIFYVVFIEYNFGDIYNHG